MKVLDENKLKKVIEKPIVAEGFVALPIICL